MGQNYGRNVNPCRDILTNYSLQAAANGKQSEQQSMVPLLYGAPVNQMFTQTTAVSNLKRNIYTPSGERVFYHCNLHNVTVSNELSISRHVTTVPRSPNIPFHTHTHTPSVKMPLPLVVIPTKRPPSRTIAPEIRTRPDS